jgi:hypothetical protein
MLKEGDVCGPGKDKKSKDEAFGPMKVEQGRVL